jgi:hypothetical protein
VPVGVILRRGFISALYAGQEPKKKRGSTFHKQNLQKAKLKI